MQTKNQKEKAMDKRTTSTEVVERKEHGRVGHGGGHRTEKDMGTRKSERRKQLKGTVPWSNEGEGGRMTIWKKGDSSCQAIAADSS